MTEEQEGKAERMFKNFGKKVDNFMEELEEASERLQKEFQEKYDDLKKTAERVKEETQNKERWKEVEDNLRKAGEELGKAFKTAFSKRKN